jgi:hypothetical protein
VPTDYDLPFIKDFLGLLEMYEGSLRRQASSVNPIQDVHLQKIFGFRPRTTKAQTQGAESSLAILLPRSPLYFAVSRWRAKDDTVEAMSVAVPLLRFHINQFAKARLSEVIREEEQRLRTQVKSLQICFVFALTERCPHVTCYRFHYKHEELTREFFIQMIQILLIQFRLMSHMSWKNRTEKIKIQS